jgi:hypothetical protein
MDSPAVRLALLLVTACASPVANGNPSPDRDAAPSVSSRCFAVVPSATPAPDVALPTMIELADEPAPGFVEPGRFKVVEPAPGEPRAPISSWRPLSPGIIELVLGGGYTGYVFTLRQVVEGGWIGEGVYFADFGVEPTPPNLEVTLHPQACR